MRIKSGGSKEGQELAVICEQDGSIIDVAVGNSAPDIIELPKKGGTLLDHIHETDADAFLGACAWAVAHHERTISLRLRFRKGNEWWIAIIATITNYNDGKLHIQIEDDLAESLKIAEGQMRALVEGSRQGAIVQSQSSPKFINEGFAKLIGYDSIEDLIMSGNVDVANHIHPDDLAMVAERIVARVEGKEIVSQYEFRLRQRDGNYIWVEALATQAEWDGQPASLAWLTDITSRKETEDNLIHSRYEAESANRAKSAFLATMSHEIRTPMNGVMGFAALLLNTSLTSEQEEFVNIIRESGETLLNIINDILDLSKIEAGALEFKADPFQLKEVVDAVIMLQRPRALENHIDLIVYIDPDLPASLVGDAGCLRQVLMNLLGNAVKFTRDGSVSAMVTKDKESDSGDGRVRVHIEVADTGTGIPGNKISTLFDRFTQADTSTTRQFGGTGLGLAISKQIVEAMGGEIGVSSAPGKGSSFWITVPFAGVSTSKDIGATSETRADHVGWGVLSAGGSSVEQDNPDVATPTGLASTEFRILLADDNITNQKLIVAALAGTGVVVDVAHDGIEAVKAARSRPFDQILMDVHMPNLNGVEATQLIRGEEGPNRHTEIVAMTSDAMHGDRERYLGVGMNDYISKPVTVADLQNRIASAIAKKTKRSLTGDKAAQADPKVDPKAMKTA